MEDGSVLGVGIDSSPPLFSAWKYTTGHGKGERFVPVLGIHQHSCAHLLQIGEAVGLTSLFSGAAEDGEENCRQDRYDSDHDEQFYQGETTALYHLFHLLSC